MFIELRFLFRSFVWMSFFFPELILWLNENSRKKSSQRSIGTAKHKSPAEIFQIHFDS